jgi:NAD(P)-dependent dehydrogenase (short-subunit alcohol dehydrogenase family)
MAEQLKGKTALVTGAGKRLGRATALELAAHGVNVLVHYRSSRKEAEQLVGEIRAEGPKAWALQADLADPRQVELLLPEAIEIAGAVDILVNNASIFPENRLTDFTPEDLNENVQIHGMTPLELSRQFAAQGRSGDIINFVDARIVDYDKQHAAYHLSKRMLHSLTRMMAIEFAPKVKVNAIAPGPILPPPGKDMSHLQAAIEATLLQRHGNPEDISRAVLFLLESHFITGQVLYIDGGRNLKGRVYD